MKEYEDIFGTNDNNLTDESNAINVENQELVNPDMFEENVVENDNVEETVIPDYSETYESVAPVEDVQDEVNSEESNMFGENIVENGNVEETVIPNYSEAYEPVTPVEDVQNEISSEESNMFGENVVENDNVEEAAIPDYSETYEPVTPVEDVVLNDNDIENVQTDNITIENGYNPMEHPDAKIILNKNVEEEKEVDPELSEMKIGETLKENSSLRFVIILGIIILIAIIAIPYVSQLLG